MMCRELHPSLLIVCMLERHVAVALVRVTLCTGAEPALPVLTESMPS